MKCVRNRAPKKRTENIYECFLLSLIQMDIAA